MLTEQRFDIILKLLEERKSITVTELRELLDASESTVRRDITALDKAGKLTKVFGGAVALNHKVTAYEPTVAQKSELNKEEKQRHINRLRTGTCTIELGFILSDISTNFERAADHCSNIAVCLLQVDEGGFDTHEYLDILKEENSEEFQHEYMELSERYALPESKHTGKKEKIAKTEKMEARKDSGK